MARVPEGNTAGLRWQHQSSAEIQVRQQAGGIINLEWNGHVSCWESWQDHIIGVTVWADSTMLES